MSLKDVVYISENSIWFFIDGQVFFWDILSFRPDAFVNLSKGKKYHTKIHTDIENLFTGEEIIVPRSFKINDIQYSNIR